LMMRLCCVDGFVALLGASLIDVSPITDLDGLSPFVFLDRGHPDAFA
jgi:hypothetical protein